MKIIKSFVMPGSIIDEEKFIATSLSREGVDADAVVGIVPGSGILVLNGDKTVYYRKEESICPKCFSRLDSTFRCTSLNCDYKHVS